MKYRRFTSRNNKVSVIGLGTWQFGGEWGQDYIQKDVDEIIDACRETGINLIDTAECYGDGLSERLVGCAVERDREKWFLATKFGHRYTGMITREQLWSIADVKKQLDESLKNLRTDYIDLYQFHSGANEFFDNPELWEMLAEMRESGKIKQIGVSLTSQANYRDYQAPLVAKVGAEAVQVLYNRLDQGARDIVFPECEKNHLGVLARVPLASGFLSGKYAPGVIFPSTDYRSGMNREKLDDMVEQSILIRQQEVPSEMNMVSWALAWCLEPSAVATVVVGSRNATQLRANAEAAQFTSDKHPLIYDS